MGEKADCCLCSQIDGRRENDLISRLLIDQDYVRRVAMESKLFAVIPSLVLLCHKLLSLVISPMATGTPR
jgi:hypothetical protein